VVVVAKTDSSVPGSKGTSLILVEKESEGFSRGRNLHKIGLHSADTSELFFDNVHVSGDAVLGGCLQLFGGYGYMREFPIGRVFVDARIQRIYGGTSEVIKEIIARDALGR